MKSLSLCLLLVLFASCNKSVTNVGGLGAGNSGGGGTAEGFGGGNIYTDRLYNIRNSMLRPAANFLVQGGGNPETFCNFSSRCPDTNNALCAVDLTLTTEQINNCGTFLFRNLQALDAQVKNESVVLEAISSPILINGSEVVASTSLDELGKIQVNIALMQNMSDAELAANLAHEYLHHVNDSAFGFIQDAILYPAVPQPGEIALTGSNLLTAAGQEIAFQAQSLALLANPPPPDPSALAAIPAATSMRLNWAMGTGVTEAFQIAYKAGETAPTSCTDGTILSSTTLGAVITYRVEGLTSGSPYTFRVCGFSNGLLSSGVTITASTLATPPAPAPNPSSLVSTPTVSAIQLAWTSGGGTTQSFQIAYASGTIAPANCSSGNVILDTVIGTAAQYTITGLAPDTDYAFRVCSQANGVLSSGATILSKTLTAPTPIPPNPGSLAHTATTSSIQLTWASGGVNTAGFQIAYNANGSAPSTCTTGTVIPFSTVGNVTVYTVTGLISSKTYSFRICAVANGLFSSGVALSATTAALPAIANLDVISAVGEFNFNVLAGTTVIFGVHPRFTSTDVTITLKNNGNGPSSNFSTELNSIHFTVLGESSSCFGGPLAAGATCEVVVRFRPLATGTFSNILSLKYNNGSAAAQEQLSLTGRTF